MEERLSKDYKQLSLKKGVFLIGLGLACLIFLMLDIITGPSNLTIERVFQGLFDPNGLELTERLILWDIRLPDALIAIVIGAALGLAGLETQTGLNNPLAEPFILGIASAGVLGASIAIVLFHSYAFLATAFAVPTLSLLFSVIASLLILFFTIHQGGSRSSVILFGIALMFLCQALIGVLFYIASAEAAQQIVFWTIGNLTKAGWQEVIIVTIVFLLVLPFSMRQVWLMTLLRSGEAQTASSGIDIARLRFFLILRVSVLSSFAVCFVGTIGFIGLVGPHIARLLLGEDHRFLLPGSCLCGAVMLSFASFLSKAIIPGVLIPVGIITSLIGVPILVFLIMTKGKHL